MIICREVLVLAVLVSCYGIQPAGMAAEKSNPVAPAEDWKNDMLRQLDAEVTFECSNLALDDALAKLKYQSGAKVNITIDPRVTSEKLHKTLITVKVKNSKLGDVLNMMLKLSELKYELRDQSVFILKPQ
jgi:hypothetical protein